MLLYHRGEVVVAVSSSLLMYLFLLLNMFICSDVCFSIEDSDEVLVMDSLLFDFDTIKFATNNFSSTNKLGQGGFGAVYKVTNNLIHRIRVAHEQGYKSTMCQFYFL